MPKFIFAHNTLDSIVIENLNIATYFGKREARIHEFLGTLSNFFAQFGSIWFVYVACCPSVTV